MTAADFLYSRDGRLPAASAMHLVPEWLHEPLSWAQHIPFAFWIMEAHRPSLFVELGTHWGNSYFAFCQAAAALNLPTACYAVDTWRGDDHAGHYGEEVYEAIARHNETRYAAFSTLVRATFDEAQPHFVDSSIDLLHIDGLHTYEACRHDFETWLPKLSDRAVVLFHDTNVRERDFGVFRLWSELTRRYPHFEFPHGHGLGVLGVGKNIEGPLAQLFAADRSPWMATATRHTFWRIGSSLTVQMSLEAARAELARTTERLAQAERAHAEWQARAQDVEQKLSKAQADERTAAEARAEWQARAQDLEQKLSKAQADERAAAEAHRQQLADEQFASSAAQSQLEARCQELEQALAEARSATEAAQGRLQDRSRELEQAVAAHLSAAARSDEAIAALKAEAAAAVAAEQEARELGAARQQESLELRRLITEAEQRALAHTTSLTELSAALDRRTAALEQTQALVDELKSAAEQHKAQIARQERELVALAQQARRDQKDLIEHFRSSTSWRVTAPLRWFKSVTERVLPLMAGMTLPAPFSSKSPPQPAGAASSAEAAPAGPAEAPVADDAPTPHEPSPEPPAKLALRRMLGAELSLFLSTGREIHFPEPLEPDVSLILVLHNQAELTYGCLRSLEHCCALSALKLEIVVLDNASTDDTRALLARTRGAKVIHSPANLHFLRGVNTATDAAKGRNLLLLNNDTLLLPGSLEAALSTLSSADDIGAVGGRIVQMDGRLQEAGSIIWNDGSCRGYGRGDDPNAFEYAFRRDVDYCSGVFLLTPRQRFEELGKLDEAFAPAYYEETDYCMRLWSRGFRVVYEPDAIVLHYEFGSSTCGTAVSLQQNNQRLFHTKHREELARHHAPAERNVLAARSHDLGKRRILLLDDRIPHRGFGSGHPRANDIVKALAELGCLVTMYPVMFPMTELFEPYWGIPKEVELVGNAGIENLESFLVGRAGFFHTILISRPHNMEIFNKILDRHRDLLNGTQIIYDAEALFAMRDALKLALSGKELSDRQLNALIDSEIHIARNAQRIVTVSELEAQEYRKRGFDGVAVVGHRLVPAPSSGGFAARSDVLFVGAIHDDDSPNADSVLWFAREVWPQLRAQLPPGTQFLVAGLNRSEQVSRLNGDGIKICGFVEDLAELYDRCRIFVAPTRYAAGIPYKVHEAAAHGLPAVSTSLIARQLGAGDCGAVLIADTPEEYVRAAAQLYLDEALWTRTREAALALVERDCSAARFKQSLMFALDLQ